MNTRPLRLGAAYHGNRMPHHAAEDFRDMASHGMDLVVHTFSHTDWDRHSEVVSRLIGMSADAGLESWVDNWGLGGPPGDKSFFLALHPEAHVIMSDGPPDPVRACVNSPAFRQFTRDWIDTVYRIGGRTIFWDEPHLPGKTAGDKRYYGCTCPICKEKFEKKYGRPMPESPDADTADFGSDQIAGYFAEMTEYSHAKGMKNAVCVMIGTYGMSLSQADKIAALDEDERAMFLEELGVEASGLDRLIRCSYTLLGLISFLTYGEDECRAWTIKNGTKAPQAAGKIHSDIERGFIRAETINFKDMIACGSVQAAKEKGLLRSEGKDYVVRDGDMIYFRFNV